MRRVLMLAGLVMLGGCGGGGTTGTNYSDAPPMAEIVATPSPKSSPEANEPDAAPAEAMDNVAAEAASDNAAAEPAGEGNAL